MLVGRGAGEHLGDAVEDPAARAAEHEKVAAAQLDVGERRGAPVDARQAEGAGVAQADRDHRRVGRFLAVLMQSKPGAGRVEVHDRGVGCEPLGSRSAP